MNFFEELTVKLKKGAKSAVKASGDVANFTKNKMQLADLKDQIREKEMKIGHIVYCKSKDVECEYDSKSMSLKTQKFVKTAVQRQIKAMITVQSAAISFKFNRVRCGAIRRI